MNVLVVDMGGTHVKILATGQEERSRFCLGADADGRADGPPGSRSSPGTGSTTSYRSAIRGWFSMAGRLRNRIISAGDGSGSTSNTHSGAQSSLSMMRPCKPWGATRVEECCFFWAWEPVSVPP